MKDLRSGYPDRKEGTMEVKNYLKINKLSLRYSHYAFVDTNEYLGDMIFANNKLEVIFSNKEMRTTGTDYVVVFCKVKKKDEELFRKSMKELSNKIELMGHSDYTDFATTQFADILGI